MHTGPCIIQSFKYSIQSGKHKTGKRVRTGKPKPKNKSCFSVILFCTGSPLCACAV